LSCSSVGGGNHQRATLIQEVVLRHPQAVPAGRPGSVKKPSTKRNRVGWKWILLPGGVSPEPEVRETVGRARVPGAVGEGPGRLTSFTVCFSNSTRLTSCSRPAGVNFAFLCTFTEDLRLGWLLISQLSPCRVGPSVNNLFSIHSSPAWTLGRIPATVGTSGGGGCEEAEALRFLLYSGRAPGWKLSWREGAGLIPGLDR